MRQGGDLTLLRRFVAQAALGIVAVGLGLEAGIHRAARDVGQGRIVMAARVDHLIVRIDRRQTAAVGRAKALGDLPAFTYPAKARPCPRRDQNILLDTGPVRNNPFSTAVGGVRRLRHAHLHMDAVITRTHEFPWRPDGRHDGEVHFRSVTATNMVCQFVQVIHEGVR